MNWLQGWRGLGILGCALVLGSTLAGAQSPATLTVYSSRSHYGAEPVFDAFTKKTGITVRFFNGNNNEVFERLRSEGARTSADVLLTVDAGNLWNAAREGLLSRVDSNVLAANIPAHLRDPENRWFGLAVRARTIMYSTARVKPSELSTYAALGDPKWKDRLCLRTSTNTYNQSLLGASIKQQGEAAVEKMVRGWVANNPKYINGDTQILEGSPPASATSASPTVTISRACSIRNRASLSRRSGPTRTTTACTSTSRAPA